MHHLKDFHDLFLFLIGVLFTGHKIC